MCMFAYGNYTVMITMQWEIKISYISLHLNISQNITKRRIKVRKITTNDVHNLVQKHPQIHGMGKPVSPQKSRYWSDSTNNNAYTLRWGATSSIKTPLYFVTPTEFSWFGFTDVQELFPLLFTWIDASSSGFCCIRFLCYTDMWDERKTLMTWMLDSWI